MALIAVSVAAEMSRVRVAFSWTVWVAALAAFALATTWVTLAVTSSTAAEVSSIAAAVSSARFAMPRAALSSSDDPAETANPLRVIRPKEEARRCIASLKSSFICKKTSF